VQGIPPSQHSIGLTEPLDYHPDIASTVRMKEPFFVKEPLKCPETRYFSDIICRYNINQILYVPVFLTGKETECVVTIDICGQKGFELIDINFCISLEELFSFYWWKEKFPNGCWDDFINHRDMNGFFCSLFTSAYMATC